MIRRLRPVGRLSLFGGIEWNSRIIEHNRSAALISGCDRVVCFVVGHLITMEK